MKISKSIGFTLVLAQPFMMFQVWAQSDSLTVPEIRVSGEAVDAGYLDSLPSVTKLQGAQLERKKKATLGESLSRELGVTSTFFGPNASRPIIRGLDGDRIRILENSLSTFDASAASPDHAIALDPLLVEEVQILRGPTALIYGGTAVGGVVNVKTLRIAERELVEPELKSQLQWSSVDRGRNVGVLGRTQAGQWVIEADFSHRGAEDYSVPGEARTAAKQASDPLTAPAVEDRGRVSNSALRQTQAGFGATYLDETPDQGLHHAGMAITALESRYGVVAEKDVLIQLERYRAESEAEWRSSNPESLLAAIRLKGAWGSYQHQEVKGGSPESTFRNRGGEFRADLKHRALFDQAGGSMQGVWGLHAQGFEFKTIGDEAFLPTTWNQNLGLFVFEEWRSEGPQEGVLRPSVGARVEFAKTSAEEDANFGAFRVRNYVNPSMSAGLKYIFSDQKEIQEDLGFQVTFTERAPTFQELFAKGDHAATAVYEQGNDQLSSERNWGVELAYQRRVQEWSMKASVFFQSFSNFIALVPTGVTPGGAEFEQSNFTGVAAKLAGAEAEIEKKWGQALGGDWSTTLRADFVRGWQSVSSESLPRMPPMRETVELVYQREGWRGAVEFQRSEAQSQLAANEPATAAFNWVNLSVDAPVSTSFAQFRLSLSVQNLFDVEARTHTSFLKESAPLPGRNFVMGLQAAL